MTYQLRYLDSNGRWIHTQDAAQKLAGQEIISTITARWKPNPIYHHFRKGGHIKATRKHVNSAYFLRADIQDFFYHVTRAKIARSLKKIGLSYEQSAAIAYSSTVRNPRTNIGYVIPFGFSQSPLLATLVLQKSELGKWMQKKAASRDLIISVYMDDILISSDSLEDLQQAYDEIVAVSASSNFPLQAAKIKGPAAKVEVFNIDLTNGDMKISDNRLGEFRSALNVTTNDNVIAGILGYIHSVKSEQAQNLETLRRQDDEQN